MNRGGVGARSLNVELQAALNPAGERKVERFGWVFAPGDWSNRARPAPRKIAASRSTRQITDAGPKRPSAPPGASVRMVASCSSRSPRLIVSIDMFLRSLSRQRQVRSK